MGTMFEAFGYIISIIFYLVVFLLTVRLLVPIFKVDRYNPYIQSIMQVTDNIVGGLTGILPKYQGIELATLVMIWIMSMIKVVLIAMFALGGIDLIVIPIVAIISACRVALDVFFFSIILVVLYSFFPSPQLGQLTSIANRFADPILNPLRKLLPDMGALDFSPLLALVIIKFLDVFILGLFV